MILSDNGLPPPAYGVICDIDVHGHIPIKQPARRIPLRHLQKHYELLKGLLKAGLIAFSDSPWASPIVIVLKTNGKDIRLCIDYKMVNAVTAIIEYDMPWTTYESSLVPVFQRRSFVDDICFGGTTFDDCLDTLDRLLSFLSHEVSPEGIRAEPKKMTAITKLPFPKSKK
ncbi:hypothetical protein PHMEG_00027052 [Phytophthora megakarya]|uniref:Reverse transcriptase domain-containing protein n=1 Tax=Phytophthora megakarya TaxID=4795 RepID=A0A225V832_9STRA|nr:hypothetical protein PHMEG_00027052 [Phytophthora megakarya]